MSNAADTTSTVNASRLVAVGSRDTDEMVRSREKWLPAKHVPSAHIVSLDGLLAQRINNRFCFTPRERLFCAVFGDHHKTDTPS